jgi:hypothetical protein
MGLLICGLWPSDRLDLEIIDFWILHVACGWDSILTLFLRSTFKEHVCSLSHTTTARADAQGHRTVNPPLYQMDGMTMVGIGVWTLLHHYRSDRWMATVG